MTPDHRRILIADDVIAIHDDYRKVLAPAVTTRPPFAGFGDFLPGSTTPLAVNPAATFDLVFVRQGEDAVAKAAAARAEGRPFAVAFLDVRMPPGIDGVEAAQRLRAVDPELQIVLCTAYSDYSLGDIARQFPECDGLMILKKPFDPVEVQQLARALGRKWYLAEQNRRSFEELEQRVARRTEELASARADLVRALERAEAASRAKSEFLANMSHELRTPLNAVLGMAELLRETSLETTQQNYVRSIHAGGEALLAIVNQIFDFMRLEDGRAVPEHADFSVRETLGALLATIAPRLVGTPVSARLEIAADTPDCVLGDAARVRQALLHVLSNAVKFTLKGEIVLGVAPDTNVERNGWLRFSIRDTGIGIPPDRVKDIFDAFTQIDASATRTRGGLGLGLAITVRLVRQLGGEISVDSKPDHGSEFVINLPFVDDREAQAATAVATADRVTKDLEASDTGFAARYPLRILVAEDSALNQQVAGLLLGRLGYCPVFVANGEEALAAFALKPYDLILMDVQMPVLDGLMATRLLRERDAGARRPWIVAMTARALAGDREECIAAGMDDYLAKPLSAIDLAAALRRGSEQLAVDRGP